jgi:uncharacterized protein YbjT (DUF2867 family)
MNNNPSKIKIILTGATGMVGEGVLHECLSSDEVSEILIISRRPAGIVHPKLKEIIHNNFFDLSPIAPWLSGYDACFFCLGVSSVGMKENEYFSLTYTLTLHVAQILLQQNPGMIFCYISGTGTDSTEKGRMMWARVKGKTENALMRQPFSHVYNFRPGILEPTKGLKNTLSFYKYLGWLIPFVRWVAPGQVCSLAELGQAMIHSATKGYEKRILEVKDIRILAGCDKN